MKLLLLPAAYIALADMLAQGAPAPVYYVREVPGGGGYNARCIPPFGIYINAQERGNTELLKHELVHWQQYQRMGLFSFYIDYLRQLKQYGYDAMPMELEARQNETSQWVKENYTEAVRTGKAVTVYNPKFRVEGLGLGVRLSL